MRTALVFTLCCATIFIVSASTIDTLQQKVLYTAPSYFYRPTPAFLWDNAGRVIVEIMGNDIFAFDVATGVKSYGNPGSNFALYNGAFINARILYLWASNSAKDSLYLLKYSIDTLSQKIQNQDKVPGIAFTGTQSVVCTAFDPNTNIAYVAAQTGSMVYAVDVNKARVVGSFDVQSVDSTLFAPLSAPCAIDVSDKTVYFAATHYDPVLGNEYRMLALDITDPTKLSSKSYVIVPGASFQLDSSTRTVSGTDGNHTLYQVDPKSNNGTEFGIPNYVGSGNGFVLVDPRDASTFFFDGVNVIGPVTLQPKGTVSADAAVQTLPYAVSAPAVLDTQGCRVYVRSAQGKVTVTYAIPIINNGSTCATVKSDAPSISVLPMLLLGFAIIVLFM
jgi:hypothetical protein